MSSVEEALARAWAALTPPTNAPLASFALPIDLATGALRVALDADGFRHLLVPTDESVVVDAKPAVLSVRQDRLTFGDHTDRYVDISCNARDLDPEFDDLIADVAEALRLAAAPGQEVVRVVARWRRLFRAVGRGLGQRERWGLFAELSLLRALRERCPDLPVGAWTGPYGEEHDVELDAVSFESKAVGLESTRVVIHGEKQLEARAGKPLHLIVLTLQPDPDGISLASLAESVLDQFDGDPRLRQAYARVRLNVTDTALRMEQLAVVSVLDVEVGDTTPKLVSDSFADGALPEGVGELRYSVELDRLMDLGVPTTLNDLAAAWS